MQPARILISTSSSTRSSSLKRMDAIGGMNYAEAINQVGGLPFFAPNLSAEKAAAYIAQVDGLLLSGGVDFDPVLFNEAPHPGLGMVDEARDNFELACYHAARKKGIPILGICRGIQAINVAEGGSLIQHLPAFEDKHQHAQQNNDGSLFHTVVLEPDSKLAGAFGKTSIRTNSYHHQAIDRLGSNLKSVAKTADNTIEAVESSDGKVLGVQWHPEMSFERYPEQIAPFRLFMEAVQQYLNERIPGQVYA
ncbi:MAG: gamma-glutamyl-gamma-aminobutyrate hydrolase family protein [Trueperaceae bacterium]|nr:gamma-glutamyl-gamma-aminobutyrate hydrolase family protein [Trueperaceae bacterium]